MATKILREKMSTALSESERKRQEEERRRRKQQQQEQEALNAQVAMQSPQKKWDGIDLSLPKEFNNGVRDVLMQEHQDEIEREAINDDLKSHFMEGVMEAQRVVRTPSDFGSADGRSVGYDFDGYDYGHQSSYDDVVYGDINDDDSDSLEASLEITESEVTSPEMSTEVVRRERGLPSIAYEMGLADMEMQSESSRPLPSMGEELLAMEQSQYDSIGDYGD